MAQLESGREILMAGINSLTLGTLLLTFPISIKSDSQLSKFGRFSLLLIGESMCVVSFYCWRRIAVQDARRWRAERRVIESIKGEEFIEKVAQQIGLSNPS